VTAEVGRATVRWNGTSSDDAFAGALLDHDPERGAADLLVLAAQDLAGAPSPGSPCPRVPLGSHGSWTADG